MSSIELVIYVDLLIGIDTGNLTTGDSFSWSCSSDPIIEIPECERSFVDCRWVFSSSLTFEPLTLNSRCSYEG